MGSAAYVHVDADGRFVFHGPDGSEHVVTASPYTPSEPWAERLLADSPFVRPAGKKASASPAGEED